MTTIIYYKPDGTPVTVEKGSNDEQSVRDFGYTTAKPAVPKPAPSSYSQAGDPYANPNSPGYGGTAGSGAPSTTPKRYPGLNDITQSDSPIDTYYKGLKTSTTPEEEAAVREQTRKDIQNQIDAINAVYNQMSQTEQFAGENRSGETRALVARSGLLGSPRGETQQETTNVYNRRLQANIEAERGAKIAQIMSGAQSRADELIAAEKTKTQKNADEYLQYLKGKQGDARTDITTLAKAGVPLDQLTKDQYQTLLNQSGYDALTFDSIYNANLPANKKVAYDYKNYGSKVVRIGSDGSFKEMPGDYTDLKGQELKQLNDGTLVIFDPNKGTYQDYGKFVEGKLVGSATRGYSYVSFDSKGKPSIQFLGGTGGGGGTGSQKIVDYVSAIEEVNNAPTLSAEDIKNSNGQISGYTRESKAAILKNIRAQAADILPSGDFTRFESIIKSNIVNDKYNYKATPDGIVHADTGEILTQTEQQKYIDLVNNMKSNTLDEILAQLAENSQ